MGLSQRMERLPISNSPLIQSGEFDIGSRSILWLNPIGRLNDGVTIQQARTQLQSFWPDVLLATASTQTPGLRRQTFLSMGLDVSSAAKGVGGNLRSQFERPLYVLAGIVGLILLVACVNLANLMLARAAARSHEMSVRVAIGASRGTLVGQVLAESLSLAFAGALLGLAFAYWGSRLLVLLMTEGTVSLDLRPDLTVLSLAVLAGLFTGLPSVSSVAFADFPIPSPNAWHETVSLASTDPNTGMHLLADGATVSSGFFQTLAIPLLRGRSFQETDDEKHPHVAIVNSALAERLFPNGDPIGKTVRFGFMPEFQNIEIIGIVGNARILDLRNAATPIIFLSCLQYPGQWVDLIVPTNGP